jgi:hypothetical protein
MWCERRIFALTMTLVGLGFGPGAANAQGAGEYRDWEAVDKALGRPGKAQPGEVQKYSFPRSDLRVTVAGVVVKPALALGSWVAFKRTGGPGSEAMAMGDLVLTQGEVSPVVAKLQDAGIRQTALHNHLQDETPRVMYLHVEGHGDPVKLADGIRSALGATKTPAAAPPSEPATRFPLDTAALARELHRSGSVNGGVYQVNVPRSETIRAGGMEVPPALGVATVMNFQPTGGGKAAITGDFVLTSEEVNPVLRSLKRQGIAVTALHSHMLREEPRLFFMHFWANDDALRLARALRTALEQTKSKTAAS